MGVECHTLTSMPNVSLTPELERFAEACVRSGRYNSVSEVTRAALRLLAAGRAAATGPCSPSLDAGGGRGRDGMAFSPSKRSTPELDAVIDEAAARAEGDEPVRRSSRRAAQTRPAGGCRCGSHATIRRPPTRSDGGRRCARRIWRRNRCSGAAGLDLRGRAIIGFCVTARLSLSAGLHDRRDPPQILRLLHMARDLPPLLTDLIP